MLLHVHKDEADALYQREIAWLFVSVNAGKIDFLENYCTSLLAILQHISTIPPSLSAPTLKCIYV